MCTYGSKYNNFLLNSLFYDNEYIISFFNGSEAIKKKISIEKIITDDDDLIKIVSDSLEYIILQNNNFVISDGNNKKLLKSIFTTFKKHYDENKKSDKITIKDVKYYPLSLIKDGIIYPDEEFDRNLISEYENLFDNFNEIVNSNNINIILNKLSTLFSYVPYYKDNKCGIGDISFYDKLKINTALSSCLYLLKENNSLDKSKLMDNDYYPFVLLSGDISGIQKFIYTISSKGALKSLRARSFYLEIMIEHIADEILDNFNLTRANLLYTGGGHFYIILPNYNDIESRTNEIMSKLNRWFISNFSIDLYIAMGTKEFNFENLKEFAPVFKELSGNLSQIKQRRYVYNNDRDQLINLLKPKKNESNDGNRECCICHTSLKPTKEIIINKGTENETSLGYRCDICHNLYNAGKCILTEKLNMKIVNFYDINKINNNGIKHKIVGLPSLSYENVYLYFDKIKDIDIEGDDKDTDNNLFEVIREYSKNNSSDINQNVYLGDYNFNDNKLLEGINNIEDYDKLLDFETLVKGTEYNKTIGINRLAVLRCDVDNLGNAFMNGFKGYADILRTSSFSRHLSLFFKYYINFICKGDIKFDNKKLFNNLFYNKEKRVVIVYSGGDDVFLVGHWLDVINFTLDLRHAFRKYTDDKLTFSAGIGFFHTKYPISKMASQTGELEELAKKNQDGKKDSVALFGIPYNHKEEFKYTFNWKEFEKVKEKIDFLFSVCYFENGNALEDKVFFSASLMYRLKQLIELYNKNEDRINIARLAYSLSRISYTNKNKENYNIFKDKIYEWFTEKNEKVNNNKKQIEYFNTALDLIIYLNRND